MSSKMSHTMTSSEMSNEEHKKWYGRLELEPGEPLAAGSFVCLRWIYTAGRYGMDNGGRIRLLFRYAWDGGVLQTTDPGGDNYVTAHTSNPDATVAIQFMPKGGRRPWLPCLMLEIKDSSLAEGDRVFVTIGDRSAGGSGHRVQTFVESDFRWLTDVECFETGTWVELKDCPVTPVVAAKPSMLAAIAPSVRTVSEPLRLTVKRTDDYGNPAGENAARIRIRLQQWVDGAYIDCKDDLWTGPRVSLTGDANVLAGCRHIHDLCIRRPGQYRFLAETETEDGQPITAVSNPIAICDSKPGLSHYWGDLHAQYNNALGTGSVEEAFQYARDAGAIEFVGHQPNDFQFHGSGWEEAKRAVKRYHEPDAFIPILGYEWSGNTPAGGDRNVHFLNDEGELRRSSHWHISDKSDAPMDCYPLDRLYAAFEGRPDVLLLPHVGGRRCDISRYYNPDLEPVIEICSCHGRFEWLLKEALSNGYTVGVVGGSDDHTGRPGAAYATSHSFGTRGGLAGIYARELTREGLFAALRARHTYATTGERIWLHVDTGEGAMMGDIVRTETAPLIRVQAAGTKPIERVDIMRNQEVAYAYPVFGPEAYRADLIRLEWGGARVKGRGRHSNWHGSVTAEGALIENAEAFAFDHPLQGIVYWDSTTVKWRSTTSGDHDGIVLQLADASPEAILRFETELATMAVPIAALRDGPVRQECGGVDQYCQISLQPAVAGPMAVDFRWQDPAPVGGRNAYWIRLVQQDGEMAWSSPIYVYSGTNG